MNHDRGRKPQTFTRKILILKNEDQEENENRKSRVKPKKY